MPDCLVLMAFREELDSHFSLIKECGEKLGHTVYRVDSHRFSGNIVEAISEALAQADLVVADLTGDPKEANPNVMYELAIAQSLGKKVLMVTRDFNSIPFDVCSYRAYIIDPDSPERVQELFHAMQDLAASTHITGPLGGQLIYGQNLTVNRMKAFGIDIAPFAAAFVLLVAFLGWERATSGDVGDFVVGGLIILMLLYVIFTTWVLGHTFGQRLLGLKVIRLDGRNPSFAQCVGRVGLSFLLVPMTYGITFFWAFKGPGYHAVHDIVTGTMIIRR